METNEILININNNLSAIYNILWWISLWTFLGMSVGTKDIKIVNIKDLKER